MPIRIWGNALKVGEDIVIPETGDVYTVIGRLPQQLLVALHCQHSDTAAPYVYLKRSAEYEQPSRKELEEHMRHEGYRWYTHPESAPEEAVMFLLGQLHQDVERLIELITKLLARKEQGT